ncbi:MAG: hypothetical protein M9920_15725 [Verrucomicrobiae bacterium]|nr:hypothetical protein [Verrucomicrobiae bacterium]
MAKRRFSIDTIAFCVFLVCGVILLLRFAKRHASVEQDRIFVFSESFASSVRIRIPSGNSFTFALGVPSWVDTNSWNFSGEILLEKNTQLVWQAILNPSNVTLGSWSKRHNLRWMAVRGKPTENLPLVPMQDYSIFIAVTNLAGCSLWLERSTDIRGQSEVQIYPNTPTSAPQ